MILWPTECLRGMGNETWKPPRQDQHPKSPWRLALEGNTAPPTQLQRLCGTQHSPLQPLLPQNSYLAQPLKRIVPNPHFFKEHTPHSPVGLPCLTGRASEQAPRILQGSPRNKYLVLSGSIVEGGFASQQDQNMGIPQVLEEGWAWAWW